MFALFEEKKPDAVINFATESHVDRSIEDLGIFFQANIIGTATMMDACRKFGNVRYYQVSTDEVYNVGGYNEIKNIDIVKLIIKKLGKDESFITYVTNRKDHDLQYAIDPTKIHNELGQLLEAKFADGIKKIIKWYLENRSQREEIISGEYQNYYEKMYSNR